MKVNNSMNGLPLWLYPGWCLNDNAKLRSAPSALHVFAMCAMPICLIIWLSYILNPLCFPTVRQSFLLFLPHSHLFSALPLSVLCATRCRAAAAHRRLSCAPIYKRSRKHRSRWGMMIHRPVGDGQRNASPLSEGVALYDVFCGVERFGCLSSFG